MRTTLTLDDDVARQLERLRQARRQGFKALVNEALRLGLDALQRPAGNSTRSYRIKPVKLRPRLPRIDDIAEVLAVAEGDRWR